MISGHLYWKVVDTIAARMPREADVSDVRVEQATDGAPIYVTIWTGTPSMFIGRGGRPSASIRAALIEELGSVVRLSFCAASATDSDPSSGHPGGVREPRSPRPSASPGALRLEAR